MAYHIQRHIYFVRGDSPSELESAKNELRIGKSVGDRELTCWGQYGMAGAEARMGKLDESRRHLRLALDGYEGRGKLASKSVALFNLGFIEIQSSRYDEAVQAWNNALQATRQTLFYVEFTAHIYPSLIEGLIGPDWRKSRKDGQVKRARRLVMLTRFFAWRFPTIRPHTLRSFGRLACISGNTRKGIRYFERAIESAKKIGARYDHARSLLDLAAVKEEGREENRRKAIELLKQLDSVIPYAERWLLGDQFDADVVAPLVDEVSQDAAQQRVVDG